jgi:glycosyltransferase involved in cell wall biosynthesis
MDSGVPSIRGLKVLIDGVYRHEAQGTGISAYSRTLGVGLEKLGADVSWLSGAEAPGKAGKLADEVALADPPAPARGPRRYVQTALRMGQGIATARMTARKLGGAGVVLADPAAPRAGATYLAPGLFVKAHYRHMLLREFAEVRVPDEVDVLHLSAPMPVKMKGVKTVTTIHDLVPIRLPWTTPDNKSEFIQRVRTNAKLSDLIVTVSEASKRDIVEILDIDPAKVAVTWQPSDLAPLTAQERDSIPRVLGKFGLSPQGYALFVGALEPKKNLRRLIEAFLETDTGIPLVIVGRRAWLWESDAAFIETLGDKAKARLNFLGYVGREDLRRLYAGAQMFLFPSLYEGFGLPALEAMTAGCPVVTSNAASLPEVCGDGALYADPLDRDDIRAKIEQLMRDPGLRTALGEAGRAQAKRFSFDTYVAKLGEAYGKLLA